MVWNYLLSGLTTWYDPLLWPLIITHIVLLFVTTGDEFNAYAMCSVSEGADDIQALQGITENTLQ